MGQQFQPIAIVGMGCRMPGGDGVSDYWKLLVEKRSAIGPVPEERLNRDLYFDSEHGKAGRTYSDLGGIVPERPIDRRVCPISDKLLRESDSAHLTLCEVASTALRDAGIDPSRTPYARTGVYVGHSGGSCLAGDVGYARYTAMAGDILRRDDDFRACSPAERANLARRLVERVRQEMPSEESVRDMKFVASNAAMLIARVHGFEGPTFVVDAACASSLMAMSQAAQALQRGDIDMALAGGASYSKWYGLVLFSMAMSISGSGSRPFDADADGLISSDGYGIVVLKTLDRALADGDRVLAVIRGIGVSSDGRGKSLWAPRPEGQISAIQRAYSSMVDPRSLDYIECHATSTQVGDATELKGLSRAFPSGLPGGRRIPIGSVKANIGHTLEAAGIAGLLKSVLAMQNGVIPPQINFNTPNPEIDWANIPFEVACQPRDWTTSSNGKPRRCAVNSFGIGGLNVHVVLDDGLLPGETGKSRVAVPGNLPAAKSIEAGRASFEPIAVLGVGTILPGALNKAALWELLVSGKDPKGDLPAGRCWDAEVLFAEKRAAGEPVPTTRGGYITDFVYDWKRHKVPPKQIANANPLQFMLLDAADQALSDAGYSKRDYDRSRASVVVGTIFGGDFAISLQLGLRLPHMQKILGDLLRADGLPEDKIEESLLRFEKRLLEKMPALMDETGSFTSSTLASRLSKSFDFMGGAFAIDSDEVSGLAAMHAGVGMLQTGVSDMVLCAAGQQAMDAALFEALQRNGMLSQGDAKSPFDKTFDGVLPAEGVAVVVLKRLADAERDGDPIRAVIRGVGQVSRYEEPEVAFAAAAQRTCELANVTPQSIGVLESSGFEATEWTRPQVELLTEVDGGTESAAARLTGITPQIGYVRGATGMVSVAKAVLELENGKVPPRFGVKSFNAASGVPEVSLPKSAEPIYASTPEGHGLIAVNHLSETGMGYSVLLESREKCPQRPVVTTTKPIVASTPAKSRAAADRWAMLFPGQGSHSEGMVARLLERTPSLVSKIAEFDRVLTGLGCPTVAALTNNPSAGVLQSQLTMLVMNLLHAAALEARGVRPVLVCGHSYGEYAALVVAGSWTFRDAVIATQHRADVVSQFGVSGGGLMAVAADGDTVRRAISRFPGEVYLANINSPEQTVVGGMVDELREFENSLKALKIVCKPLTVPAAYHTPLLEAAVGEFRERLKSLPIAQPIVPVLSGVGNQLVSDPEVIRENLARQLVTTMDFVDMVHQLEEQGVTLAIECGPKQVLTNLVRKAVGDARLTVLPTDPRDSQGFDPLAGIVSTLAQRGVLTPPASAPNTVPAVTEKAAPVSVPSSRILHFDATQRRKDQNRQRAVGTPEPEPAVVPFVAVSTPKVEEPVAAVVPAPVATSRGKLPNRAELQTFVTEYIVDQTGYPAEMIELDADLEADLGIDSIKKAQMLGECAQKFELNWLADEVSDLSLDQFPSLGHIIDFLTTERAGSAPVPLATSVAAPVAAPIAEPVAVAIQTPVASTRGKLPNRAELQTFVTEYIVDQTGYPAEMIELDADLEADLGIDSIKKAQMLGECAQKFELNWLADEVSDLSLDQFPSLGHIIDFLTTERVGTTPAPAPVATPAVAPITEPIAALASAPVATSRGKLPNRAELTAFVTEYIVDQTGYPAEMIELDADLEADLGIDSIKKAQMLGECAQKFELNWLADEVSDLSLDQFPSLGHIIDFLTTERTGSAPASAPAPAAEPVVAAASAPVATSRGKLPNRAELQTFVTDYIVDQTGYPAEMIELDADLEADLGIDSIKKAQMLGECAQKFELNWLADEVSDLSLDQFPSLGHIIDFLTTERVGAAPAAAPVAAPAVAPITEPVVVAASAPVASTRGKLPNRAELQAFVTDYIVDQTGYPAEMIELDADLEADLGIDSIKKAQMLGECAQKFELNWLADEVSDLSLDQFPSLGHIIDFLTTDRTSSEAQVPAAPVAANASQDESTQQAPEVVTSVATLTAEPIEQLAELSSELVTRLVCGGDPYELGLAHGKHQRDAIRRILESQISRYGSRLTNMPELDQALQEPNRYFGDIELAELRGIADGADLPLDFLVAHNLGLCEDYVPGCVHFAVTSRANGRNRLIHAANEDSSLALSLADSLKRIVQFRQPSKGYRHVSFSVSGQLAGINGTNEKGLSVSSTLLLDRAPRDVTAQGDIHPVLVKRMLQYAATIPEAIAILRQARRNGAWSVCISHYPTDSLCYIEYDRDEMIVRENLTRLIGTNHALLLKPTHPTPPHSVHRLERLQDLLNKYENDGISSQSAEVLLRDQFDGRRQRITAHPTMNTIRRVDNQISVVMRPEVSQVRITPGPTPREVADQYSTIPLSGFFQGKADGGAAETTPASHRATTISVSPQREPANPLKGFPPVSDRVMRRVILRPLPTAGDKVTGDESGANRFPISGRVLVQGQGNIAEELIVGLRKEGLEVEHMNWAGDLAGIEQAFNALAAKAPIQHLFVVAPRSSQELPTSEHAERFVPVFRLVQLWAQQVAASGLAERATMTALTFMGGDFGLSGSPVGADGGSHTGFWKALRREFGGLPARVIDFPADEQPHRVLTQLRAELNRPFELCEVAYSRGQRFRLAGLPVPVSTDIAQGPTAGSAWVITGGARGVTAVVARELGLRFGVHLHLVGSSPLPEFDPAWTTASADELKTIRRTVMAEARERGEVPLDAWNRIERGLEVEKTLRTMRQAGMKVTYHSCDVASRGSVEETMSAIRAMGAPIEGVIHGAGVEAACRFDRKQAAIVRKTFAVKVDGARHLADVLEHDPVRYFVGFGSTSGRFGGLGQADYSAASDALAKFCNDLGRRRPDCRTIAVHWPPWDEVGMAARPESKLALAAGGMGFMPPLEGAAFLLEELLATNPEPEILIIDKPDGLDLDKTLPDRAVWDDYAAAQDRTNQSPLLDTVVDYVAGDRAWVEARLDPSADPFLYDHQHRDAPILPMAFGMELLAETLGVLRPDLAGITMSHIEVVNGLRFFSGHPERVTARIRREGDCYIGELVAPFRNRKGVLLENNRLLVRAELRPAADRPASEKSNGLGTPRVPVDYADSWQQIGEPKFGSVYTGPTIRGLIDIARQSSQFEGTIEPPSSTGFSGQRTGSRWRLAPAVLDACYIACDRWASLTLGRLHLPQQLRELTVYRPTADSDSCVVSGEVVEQADQHLVFNFGLRTRSGEPLLDVQGFKIVSAAGTQTPPATSTSTEPAVVIESTKLDTETLPRMVFPVEACTRQSDRWEAELRIEPRTEPLLAEHRFNDRPLLPAVAMIEIFSEALRAVVPGANVPRIRDFVIRHSLHFQAALPRRVQVVAVKADNGWDAKLIDVDGGEVVLATARLDRIEHARAELLTMDTPTAKFGPMNYPDSGAPMYHGAPFRCLTELCLRRTAGWGHIAPTPIESLLVPNAQADLVVHPGVLDACFVAGGVDAWIYNDGRVELPLAFDELLVLRNELPRAGEALTVRLWPADSDETGSTCHLLLCDSSGSPIYQLRSYRSVVKGEVKR